MSVTLVLGGGLGTLKLEIFCDTAPKCAFNFLALAAAGCYDGTLFHRNIPGFMIQGGDPSGTGKGGESIWGAPFLDEFHPDNKHDKRGMLAMANNGPNTNGSQFFITYAPQLHLNGQYSVFGQVIDGLEVLDQLEKVPVGKKNRPETDIVLERIVIHANPLAT